MERQPYFLFRCFLKGTPIQTCLPCILRTKNMIPTKIKNRGPRKPSRAMNFVPKNLSMGRFNLSAIRYILGTITRVRKKEKSRPKMIVQLKGPQNTTLSPPKKILGRR